MYYVPSDSADFVESVLILISSRGNNDVSAHLSVEWWKSFLNWSNSWGFGLLYV